jgi:hypothetical protein
MFRCQTLCALAPHLPEDLWSSAVDLADGMSGLDSRKQAFSCLAPFLPDGLYEQFLQRAISSSTDEGRAECLGAMAPWLPSKLLRVAVAAVPPRETQTAIALLERIRDIVVNYPTQENRAAFDRIVCLALRGRAREDCLRMISATAPAIAAGGEAPIREIVTAVEDVYAWWP